MAPFFHLTRGGPAHQPPGGLQGRASDILFHAEEMRKTKHRMITLYAAHCGCRDDQVE
ncbi:ATP-dependent Clp protease proteolytic subunit [Thalassospira mesophila]|uniref:ATP-dependent Clp protease proteolytic subunit n=1 Tax=Thalassospira mesophila TaxID=1293891 RepID=UPI001B8083C7